MYTIHKNRFFLHRFFVFFAKITPFFHFSKKFVKKNLTIGEFYYIIYYDTKSNITGL